MLKEASEEIKEDFIPKMTNLLMDVFQFGIDKGSELGVKVASEASNLKNQSSIKWQTGEPKENGIYLVTTSSNIVRTIYWNNGYWLINDLPFSSLKIKAWCKLSDIEPYKDESSKL